VKIQEAVQQLALALPSTWSQGVGGSLEVKHKIYALLWSLEDTQRASHALAVKSGWWSDRMTGEPLTLSQVNIAEKLCLIHSEVSEAMEGARKGLKDDHLPHRDMLEVELADAVIRILDLAGYLKLDIAGAVVEKLAYNQQRADHKLENRAKDGGKAF